ncbi:N-acetylglucosamine-6-phosphate deacetylase [Canibacter zhoujuaniae]|uniref:N-acetylglucosamine-6-phosphate deacetylase n=1 Tax=Canibacter zhoujuaniae TaxID=2708343 RepID=UPI001FBAAD9E|nr:N-acetylglucosamine-6-phosphate deacetylase [Canibacter zhoujuaniae]
MERLSWQEQDRVTVAHKSGYSKFIVRAQSLYGVAGVAPLTDGWFAVADGRVLACGSGPLPAELPDGGAAADLPVLDYSDRIIAPGYIDIHCHGAGGYAFDQISEADGFAAVAAAKRVHQQHGTTRQILSLVTADVASLEARCMAAAELCETDPHFLGIHLEGPFLAVQKCGAHDPNLLIAPNPEHVERLLKAAGGWLRQVTLAPELAHSEQAIAVLQEAGVRVAVGHTDCDFATAAGAFAAGASILTHAFNGMNGLQHRAPGPVAAAFDAHEVVLEVIADGHHVHPRMIQLLHEQAAGRVALITDAMSAAGMPDGPAQIGELAVAVVDGLPRLVREDGTLGSIAGSTLTMERAVQVAVASGWPLAEAIAAATAIPARAIGAAATHGSLQSGYVADFVVLNDSLEVLETWVSGTQLTS